MGDLVVQMLIELIPWRITVSCGLCLGLVWLGVLALNLAMPGAGVWGVASAVGLSLGFFWQYYHRVSTRF